MSKVKTDFITSSGDIFCLEIDTPDSSAFDIYGQINSAVRGGDLETLQHTIKSNRAEEFITLKPIALDAC